MQYAKAKANKQEQKIIDLQEKILQIKDANCHSGPSSSIACNSSLETKQTEQQSTQKYIFFSSLYDAKHWKWPKGSYRLNLCLAINISYRSWWRIRKPGNPKQKDLITNKTPCMLDSCKQYELGETNYERNDEPT